MVANSSSKIGGSFGVVYKAIEIASGEVVAIKHVSTTLPRRSRLQREETDPRQIDLESSDDDIQDIQQEISVLSTCDSPFVTQYKTSFLRGYKLWIVMEYLGGGSCLDLVSLEKVMVLEVMTKNCSSNQVHSMRAILQ